MRVSLLLIDDDAVDRLSVRRELEGSTLDVEIVEAVDAESALSRIASGCFDCVILDQHLPGSDGLSLVRQIREGAAKYPPIVMLTGRGDEQLAVDLMKAGATDYLCKSALSPDRLEAAVRSAVRISKEQEEVRYAQEALRDSEAFNRAVLDSLPTQIVVVDITGTIMSANSAWRRFAAQFGHSDSLEMAELDHYAAACERVYHLAPDEAASIWADVADVVRGRLNGCSREFASTTAGGTYWFGLKASRLADNKLGAVIAHTDITAQKAAERELVFQAGHDGLTRLPNKTVLLDRLRVALHRLSRRPNRTAAALFLDLDHFKIVNDSLGHAAGDCILVETACRLRASLRESDLVARLGGDEFVILLEDLDREEQAFIVAEKIQAAVRRPIRVQSNEFLVSASIGVVLLDPADDPQAVLRNADMAMYEAKSRGRGCFALYGPEMHAAALEAMTLRRDLPVAIRERQLFMEYQPIVSLPSASIVGFEALVRWRRADGTVALPSEFIPLAEESGLIGELDRFALLEACRQVRQWQECAPPYRAPPFVSVNLSARNFRKRNMVAEIDAILAETGATQGMLVLELTESAYAECAESVALAFQELRDRGIRVYIDDFGVGYSSLSYLTRLPIDAVKIDRSFVRESMVSSEGVEVVRAISALARALNVSVVAEGIETNEQQRLVCDLDCEFGQGHLFGRPLDAIEATALVSDDPRPSLVGSGHQELERRSVIAG